MVDNTKNGFLKIRENLNSYLAKSPINGVLESIKMKTGVGPVTIIMAICGILAIYLVFGWKNDFLCNIIILIYPVYISFDALQSAAEFDQRQLLTFWIIYSLLDCIEYLLRGLLDFLVFYWLAKSICLLVYWMCYLPHAKKSEKSKGLDPKRTIDKSLEGEPFQRLQALIIHNIPPNARCSQDGVTVAGGNGQGSAKNQLQCPYGLFVDDDETIVIADCWNHRIVQWKKDDTNGQVVAGGKGEGRRLNQLNYPTDVLIDKETDSLIICDRCNRRVVRWSRRSGTRQVEILIDNIACRGLTMDHQRNLYVSDVGKHEVRRYRIGDKKGTLVAGGNGEGSGLDQFRYPRYMFVDRQQTLYVSDSNNHRVMKWHKGATQGIVVAGGQGYGKALTQLSYPNGLFVDHSGTLYIADSRNHRVIRWPQGAKQGTVIAGGNGEGSAANQFNRLSGLSVDRQGNLYVADWDNHRVQRFSIA